MIIIIMAIYSKAWSFGGEGIDLNIYMVVSFNLALIIGGVIGAFSEDALNIILYILAFVVGICGVAICANETLFLFRLKMLKKVLL